MGAKKSVAFGSLKASENIDEYKNMYVYKYIAYISTCTEIYTLNIIRK